MEKIRMACAVVLLAFVTTVNVYIMIFRSSHAWALDAMNMGISSLLGLGWGMLLGVLLVRIDSKREEVAKEKEFFEQLEKGTKDGEERARAVVQEQDGGNVAENEG